jgi:hypothetical protein
LLDFFSFIAVTDWHESVIARPLVSLLHGPIHSPRLVEVLFRFFLVEPN